MDIGDELLCVLFRRYDLELLRTKVKELIGLENCESFISGAAPISFELKQYLARFGISLKEVRFILPDQVRIKSTNF